jgi:hypothetical protein
MAVLALLLLAATTTITMLVAAQDEPTLDVIQRETEGTTKPDVGMNPTGYSNSYYCGTSYCGQGDYYCCESNCCPAGHECCDENYECVQCTLYYEATHYCADTYCGFLVASCCGNNCCQVGYGCCNHLGVCAPCSDDSDDDSLRGALVTESIVGWGAFLVSAVCLFVMFRRRQDLTSTGLLSYSVAIAPASVDCVVGKAGTSDVELMPFMVRHAVPTQQTNSGSKVSIPGQRAAIPTALRWRSEYTQSRLNGTDPDRECFPQQAYTAQQQQYLPMTHTAIVDGDADVKLFDEESEVKIQGM